MNLRSRPLVQPFCSSFSTPSKIKEIPVDFGMFNQIRRRETADRREEKRNASFGGGVF